MSLDLQAIRERAKRRLFNGHVTHAEEDRDTLLAEVEVLTEERDAARAWARHRDAQREELQARLDRVRALAEEWRYKGERGPTWYEAYGPNPEDHILDNASDDLLQALDGEATDGLG